MENPIKVYTIDGISFPIIHDDFFDISLPHVGCGLCKYAVCAKCVDLFSFNHECKYKYFDESLRRKEYICKPCKEQRHKELKQKIKTRFRNKNKNI